MGKAVKALQHHTVLDSPLPGLAQRLLRTARALLPALLLAACGGGGEKPADEVNSTAFATPLAVIGPDSFLLWPNRQATPDGTPPATDSLAYAQAYYRAIDPVIDPANAKDTLQKWKDANGFDKAGGEQVTAVFGDFVNLGYGRRMTARYNPGATPAQSSIAFLVENYLVNPAQDGYGRGINLDAAVVQDRQWIVSINAIEFSPGPGGSVRFAKFFSFNPTTGARVLTQNLDGRGDKPLPGVCTNCHGGRADALAAASGSSFAFLPLQNSKPAESGDVRGRLHALDASELEFSSKAGFTLADQQAALKKMNQWVLCSIPRADIIQGAEDGCRDAAKSTEWQGAAGTRLKLAYGGPGMPAAGFNTSLAPPAEWAQTAAQTDLYQQVVMPACLVCHQVLGTGQQSEIDFTSAANFDAYAESIRRHVFERGDMPLSRVLFKRFWSTDPADGGMARKLADYLATKGLAVPRDAAGAPRLPDSPVAVPGPDRRVALAGARLSATNSLFFDRLRWRLVSGPDGAVPATGATLSGADTLTPTFTPTAAASGKRYVLELVASRGAVDSAPAQLKLYVNSGIEGYPNPSKVGFEDIKAMVLPSCTGCHRVNGTPPLAFDGPDEEVYRILRGALNFGDLGSSPLLRKPTGEHHGGNSVDGYCTTVNPAGPECVSAVPRSVQVGEPFREHLDTLVDWALAGAPRTRPP